MSTFTEIESAITRLTLKDAEELQEWLEQWLEDQMEMTPDFDASIEQGKPTSARAGCVACIFFEQEVMEIFHPLPYLRYLLFNS